MIFTAEQWILLVRDQLEFIALEPFFDIPLVDFPVARNRNQLFTAARFLRLPCPVDFPNHVQMFVVFHVRTVRDGPG